MPMTMPRIVSSDRNRWFHTACKAMFMFSPGLMFMAAPKTSSRRRREAEFAEKSFPQFCAAPPRLHAENKPSIPYSIRSQRFHGIEPRRLRRRVPPGHHTDDGRDRHGQDHVTERDVKRELEHAPERQGDQ